MSRFRICYRPALVVLGLFWSFGYGLPARAQPGSGGPGTGAAAPTAIPLDGGASLLLAAGVGYGLKRLRQARRARR